MKHWTKDGGGFYNLALDEDHRVLSVVERPTGIMEITEECNKYFCVLMSKSNLIDALRELADELESK
tara:strand:- start:219 stop:419 length:201 start_codon:yes stop_codon:yes gene_type:complete